MSDIRFIRKDGQSVDIATVRERFFESAVDAEVNPKRASYLWDAAMFGDTHARKLIEELCEIQLVRSDAGFGFLE
jgi:hypothetical protein